MLSRENLPTTAEQLRELCLTLQSTLVEKDQALFAKERLVKDKQTRIDYLEEQLNLLRSKRYQASSETLNQLQSQLFDESELEVAIQDVRDALADMRVEQSLEDKSSQARAKTKISPKRKAIPDHLKRVEIVIDVSDKDKHMMGNDWEAIGYEVSEQVAVKQRVLHLSFLR